MGELSSSVFDTLTVVEHMTTRRRYLSSGPSADYKVIVSGRVFFDHVRGLLALPEPAPKGYALIEFWYDYDWTQQHGVPVTLFADANALVTEATRKVAEGRAATSSSNMELNGVYGIVVD